MLKISVRVTPRASRARLALDRGRLHAWVTAPPLDGKANQAVRALVAAALEVREWEVQIIAGERGREKVLLVPDGAAERLRTLLAG
ncbi:MAG: hypothetical protein AUH85_12705 [Chloroflexi bacterium 13_1_40CM_4_68_4]|nr:MAG: hypothetical protein AUH85_12705 [Chloroflexi bacterium 13_1_40CM_4_68_4]